MRSEYEGATLREKLYGPGVVRLRDDHTGHRLARRPTRPHTPKVPEAQPAAQGASL